MRAAVTDHAKKRARQRLGADPSPDWWQGVAESILKCEPTSLYNGFGNKWAFATDDGDALLWVAASIRRYKFAGSVDVIVSIYSVWLATAEQEAARAA
jgi:hypothetical protein